jgi:hypothetical protein
MKEKATLYTEGEEILRAIHQIQQQLECAKNAFANATEDALIDSCIYEIIALHKKYEYFLKAAKDMGLQKIG